MSVSEIKARQWLEKKHPGARIIKVPDYKQTCSSLLRGLPDFMVFSGGVTYWYEIKYTTLKHHVSLTLFTYAQVVEFKRMLFEGGIDVNIVIYRKDSSVVVVKFSEFLKNSLVHL